MNQKQRKRRKQHVKLIQHMNTEWKNKHPEEDAIKNNDQGKLREIRRNKRHLIGMKKKKKNKIGRIRKLVTIGVLSTAKGAALEKKIWEKEA